MVPAWNQRHVAVDDCHGLAPTAIAAINPNTKTAPVFRARADAELTAKIYARVPVLIDETKGRAGNPWNVRLRTMFHKSNASSAGHLKPSNEVEYEAGWLSVHEGDYGHQFDHRFGTFFDSRVRATTAEEHRCVDFEPTFEFVAYREAYVEILERWQVSAATGGILGFRRVARSTDDRTSIAAILPLMPMTYGWIVLISPPPLHQALLVGAMNGLVLDYCLRNALSQPSIPQNVYEQLPFPPPEPFSSAHRAFIVPRTSHAMAPFARELGHAGPPFVWDDDRRAHLRAELDAFYARAYGLTRDELRYILDPADVKGPDYPSETFRVLKANDIRRFGDYRTARLVLAAWDRFETDGTFRGLGL